MGDPEASPFVEPCRRRSPHEVSSDEQRQQIIRLVVREVLIGEDDITIRHSIPIPRQRPAIRFPYCVQVGEARATRPHQLPAAQLL
jgi:hypothetical protein